MSIGQISGDPADRQALKVVEFAAAVGTSPKHVAKHIRRGVIPAFQFGPNGSYRIPKSFLDRITGAGDGR